MFYFGKHMWLKHLNSHCFLFASNTFNSHMTLNDFDRFLKDGCSENQSVLDLRNKDSIRTWVYFYNNNDLCGFKKMER